MLEPQRQVARFLRLHGLQHDPEIHALDLVSEVGELAKEVLLAAAYGRRSPQFRPELADEVGDALYSLLALAHVCDVDAGDALQAALSKVERRLAQRGDAGST
jgi:NTP pyrophosphatase (non-canonical NTP hydrolase)